jgi:hypothetical protein
MNILDPKTFIACDVVASVVLLTAFDRYKRWSAIRRYKWRQNNRAPLSGMDFCKRLSVDENNASFVHAVRENLAKRPSLNPSLIYPEDELWDGFDFEIVEVFDEPTMNYFCENYEYFSDDVKRVGDLVKFLIQVCTEAKLADSK